VSYLAPHPWDAFGSPPPPGKDYQPPEPTDPTWTCEHHSGSEQHTKPEECIDALEIEADEADEEAERLADEASEKRSTADECRRLADELRPKRRIAPGQDWIEVTP